jgi:ubiquinone/menaquinone biosynthesis C-methylase UbiE
LNHQYVFDNAAPETGQRFRSLEALYDPRTERFLEATGVGSGWQCLEVGAGSGSIATWLAERVGPSGHVLVTDIDARYLETLTASARPNVEVRNHDVGTDPLPDAAFDLVHARLVLIHVPQREAALARMVRALKPGGWIVVEDFDPIIIDRGFPAPDPESYAAFATVRAAMGQVMQRHGVEPEWARSLYRRFVGQGLLDVGLEGHFAARPGGSQGALLERSNIEQVRAEVVAAGLVTDEQIDVAIARLNNPGFAFCSPVMMTAWGRKP